MERSLVTEAELLQWLNAELHNKPDYVDCHLDGPIYRLKVNDVDGCNWSEPLLRGSGMPVKVCRDRAAEVVHLARQMFNLK